MAEFPAEANLVIACRQLDYLNIRYDLRRSSGVQQLWVANPEQVDQVVQILQITVPPTEMDSAPARKQALLAGFERFPVVCITLVLGVLGALVVPFQFDWVHWLTFQEFVIVGDQIGFRAAEESFDKGQYWRLLTPAFLHFGIFHIAFNSLWLWELGRRVELLVGSAQSAVMLLLMAVGANIAQYWWSGPSLFGGLSGVVYGLLGYLWIRHKIAPQRLTQLPRGVVGFMLAWLFICMTGVIDALMAGSVANAAHAGGLLIGMALAVSGAPKAKNNR
ncbi:MAG: rhomboid family intramembrane serine protease [Porticoccaceae bacterium]|nr:rhomboid family intramembrane serine protease [Pseudomonadales bacterium]